MTSSQTDWEKVAQLAKFKTPKYARDQWAIVKNKLSGASSSSATTPINNKSTPTRKRKKIEGKKGVQKHYHVHHADISSRR